MAGCKPAARQSGGGLLAPGQTWFAVLPLWMMAQLHRCDAVPRPLLVMAGCIMGR